MLFSSRLAIFLLLVFPATILLASQARGGSSVVAYASEDAVVEEDIVEGEEEEEEAGVEEERDPNAVEESLDDIAGEKVEEDEEEESTGLKSSSDAECQVLFVKPLDSANLPSGAAVRLVIGFANRGPAEKTFIVHSVDAAFRYPQDFSYVIQNFTESVVDKTVKPNHEASFDYSFFVSENFNSRPFGLTVNVNYQDENGTQYQNAVFNETVNITEPEEGFDGETFFMYVTLAALVVLLFIGVQQGLKSMGIGGKKSLLSSKSRKYETGTQNNGDIDMDYIPVQNLQAGQSPRRTPRTSPKQRRARRNMD